MLQSLFSTPLRAVIFLSMAMAAGDCYVSKYTLAPPDKAKVEAAYCGKWQSQDGKMTVLICNFDDKQYLVQVTGDDNKATPYSGFLADVKGAKFAHTGVLTTDGKPPEAWLIQRVELKDQQLVIRDLNKSWFEEKNPSSAAELRTLIEDHVNDDAIYEGGGNVMTRVEE